MRTPGVAPKYFVQYTRSEKVSRRSLYTHCVFPGQVWHRGGVNGSLEPSLTRGGVNGSLDIKCLHNPGLCLIEDDWATFVYRIKSWKFLMQVDEKSYNTCTLLHADLLPLQYSIFFLSREWASLYSDRFYLKNTTVHADASSSPKQTILHWYRNEKNTVNQLQLNYSTNIHWIHWLMSLTKLRRVGHLFTYVKTCERDRVKDFEQQSRV